VLVVDDDVPTRVGVAAILASDPDIDVVAEAGDGVEACRLAERLAPDVVVMDVQLPILDGIEATRRLAASPAAPRVLVLTTFDLDLYAYRSIEAGASGFLLKRTRAEDLVEAVRTIAGGSALPSPARTTELIAHFAEAGRPDPTFVPPLTEREVEVLVLIARGMANDEIATELGVALETVRTHVKHVYAKCGARDRAHAVIAAYESGLVAPGSPDPDHPRG
jgi:DNA-binding NarL/FixJ family response regulator